MGVWLPCLYQDLKTFFSTFVPTKKKLYCTFSKLPVFVRTASARMDSPLSLLSSALDTPHMDLMMEEADILLNKCDAQLLRRLEYGRVILAATGSGNVLDTRTGSAEHVIDEGELAKVGPRISLIFNIRG